MSTFGSPRALRLPRPAVAVLGAGLAAALVAALGAGVSGDYVPGGAVGGDNAAPALLDLAHGRLGAFASHQPLMGLASLLVRLPAVAIASAVGSGPLTIYRVGALVCLLPAALLIARLLAERPPSWRVFASGGICVYALLLSPVTASSIRSGHPEELLAATVMAAAVLAAICDRPGWAGALLGFAVGTKMWTVIALVPVLAVLPGHRVRATATAAAAAAVLVGIPALADPAAFTRASHALGDSHLVTAFSAWWPGHIRPPALADAAPLAGMLPLGLGKSAALALPLVGAMALAAVGSRHADGQDRAASALTLLALLGLARCAFDPAPVEYYYLAVLMPLAVWELAAFDRLPVATLLTTALVTLSFSEAVSLGPSALNFLTLSGSLLLAGYLAVHAFGVSLRSSVLRPIRTPCR